MAEDNNQENEKKSPLKLILMIVGGIVLLGLGLGIGILMGGDDSDPSSEITDYREKENPEANESESEEEGEEVAEDCAEEEKDEEGNCPTGPKKNA